MDLNIHPTEFEVEHSCILALDDLIGYLILLKIARDEPNRAQTTIELNLDGVMC